MSDPTKHPNNVDSAYRGAGDRQTAELYEELCRLKRAVAEHHAQKADDRCWMDDEKLYQAAGLPTPDHRVGDRFRMLQNCVRFIERRCEGGHWPSYAELEALLLQCVPLLREGFPSERSVDLSKRIERALLRKE